MRKNKADFVLKSMKKDSVDYDGYMALAAAILAYAVDDYKVALIDNNEVEIRKIERFFLSPYGQLLSFDHGEYLIDHTRQIVAEEDAKLRQDETKQKNIVADSDEMV